MLGSGEEERWRPRRREAKSPTATAFRRAVAPLRQGCTCPRDITITSALNAICQPCIEGQTESCHALTAEFVPSTYNSRLLAA